MAEKCMFLSLDGNSFASARVPTAIFSVTSALPEKRAEYNSSVSSGFRALPALSRTRAKIISFVFMPVRTLS
jgi:hypothetical protein